MIYYTVTDEKTVNNKKLYVVDNTSVSTTIDDTTLRNMIKSSDIKILNAKISNNNKIVWDRSKAINKKNHI